jgi:endonuclease YncB( thermonuclease family)
MTSQPEMEGLCEATVNSCPLFSLQGKMLMAKVVDVYDGDTCDIVVSYLGTPHRFKARMYGYDSPEMKPSLKIPNRDEIKAKAKEAKQRLIQLVTNGAETISNHRHLIQILCGDFDKYGRLLVTALPPEYSAPSLTIADCFESSFNHIMIQDGHGYAYFGGTKQQS